MRRTKVEAEQTRQSILDAAERVFCSRGISAATLEGISREAGVTRGAFYWHFRDKQDLLTALRERSKLPQEDIVEAASEKGHDDPIGLLEEAGLEMLSAFEAEERRQNLFRIMSSQIEDRDNLAWLSNASQEMFEVLEKLLQRAQDNGMLNSEFTPKEAAVCLMASMHGLLGEWLRTPTAFSLSSVGSKLVKLQCDMLRKPVKGPSPR